ncbi:sulfite reductase (NADPH) hemoprotein beta-component [Rhodoferax ferrireducens]|uniref:Sulfite reductase (NADPH) hemoprotein beta-component n=1 Tax=Rhodoferax ferrireducens TaxID=192843 RepID=A0ABU2C9W9_9BURK|nr:nitrite/sulfite reductase [Rhodoferax ferrireducens]MDR7378106.1 sulfite reductase (NADPH) hemoprotein beta-component [Rhodoferax ferrireducens]
MYQYTEFDKQFVQLRAAQYRDQLERWQKGTLAEDEFRPLRLQNGWYVQRFAPMLRVAVPYGELNSAQLRVLGTIARDYDKKDAHDLAKANPGLSDLHSLPSACAHFTTRQNVQFNWIPLDKSADVMDLLASVHLHGIQTSGNCIRNTTSDERAGIAADEIADPRPLAEIIRQWSTLHHEFAFLPRKFKIAIVGATDDRAATAWHDVGLHVLKNEAGEVGLRVMVGGGMGRTPVVGTVIRDFLPWNQILNYLEAVVRVYNRWGRRDNMYKARIKILVKAEGQRYIDEVEDEYQQILTRDGAPHTISQAELDRVTASFVPPASRVGALPALANPVAAPVDDKDYTRWLKQNVAAHQNPLLRAVTLSFKRLGYSPGDATAEQLDAAADLADRYSAGETRVTHDQNLVLPWVRADELPALYAEAKALGLAKANIRLLTDMIVCPGGDFCSLANARSLPISEAISQRYQDMDELHDLGEIDVHMSGCINSCGHHHSAHIGILGVDKDGQEWYQVTLAGSDGSNLSGPAIAGKVVGPSFSAAEVPEVIEAVLDTYRSTRNSGENFIDTLRRVGQDPFKLAANNARISTGKAPRATAEA